MEPHGRTRTRSTANGNGCTDSGSAGNGSAGNGSADYGFADYGFADHGRGDGAGLRVGPVGPRLEDVRRVVVLRGGGLGDALYAVPALHALRGAYPQSELTLLCPPGHADLFAGRPGPVDEFVPLPVARGVHEPSGAAADPAALADFFARMRSRRFDLAVQLHGGGRWSNPFVRELGARCSIGARAEDALPLDRWLPYRYYQGEVMRALEIVGLAGARPTTLLPQVAVTRADLTAADDALAGLPRPLVTVHPGASDPRRHWPAERFAELAAQVVRRGWGVAVIGSAAEQDLVHRVVTGAREQLPAGTAQAVRDLAGALTGSALVGVLARSAVLVGNDSGPGHLAVAVGTPTVRLFWIGNVISAAPPGRAEHRVLISWLNACQLCGASYTDPGADRCPHDASALEEIRVEDVLAEVTDLLAAARSPWRGSDDRSAGTDSADRRSGRPDERIGPAVVG